MSKDEIRSHTEALLNELKGQTEVDEKTRAELEELAQRIHENLGDSPETGSMEDYQGRLEKVALEFQDQHPGLSEIMRRISQALANMGI